MYRRENKFDFTVIIEHQFSSNKFKNQDLVNILKLKVTVFFEKIGKFYGVFNSGGGLIKRIRTGKLK